MSRPFIPAPNMSSIELIYSAGGYIMENVLHTRKGSPFSLADLQTQRGIVDTWDSTNWKNRRHVTVQLIRIKSKALDTASSAVDDYPLPSPRAGTDGTTAYPLSSTFAVKFATTSAGRSARGRLYIPGLTNSVMADSYGNLTSGGAAGFVSSLNALFTALIAGGFTPIVLSYRHNKAWRSVAAYTDIVQAVAVDLRADVQRRRLPGRGI